MQGPNFWTKTITLYGIPPLLKNNNLIFNDLDKANEFNNFFAMQTDLDDSAAVLPELSLPENQFCDIVFPVAG
jgi:hypothetical protein